MRVLFRQFVNDDLGCASYLVGDQRAGAAAVVDPALEVGRYLRAARYLGVRIVHVLETHTHADHLSGHGRLAEATGARIHIHQDAGAGYPHEAIGDGWTLALGRVLVRAIHTPGHRPEHTAFALSDLDRGPEPWAVLTGDSLFVGDLARPDLAIAAERGRARSSAASGACSRWLPTPRSGRATWTARCAAVERRLREACGEADLEAARRALEELVGWRGGPIEALARRAKPVW